MSWKNLLLGGLSGAGAAVASYWNEAPHLMRVAAECLGPLLMAEAVTAAIMRGAARRQRLEPGEQAVELYPNDTWMRAGERLGLTLGLVCLAATADAIAGTPHQIALWALLWGVGGAGRATLRHLRTVAQIRHFDWPSMPMDQFPHEPKGGDRRSHER